MAMPDGTKDSSSQAPVVVGIDGSDSSVGAALWAAYLAEKARTRLHLVHSAATTASYMTDAGVIAIRAAAPTDQFETAEKVLARAERAVNDALPDLLVTTEITSEPADITLIRLSHAAQFIVLGCEDVSRAAALLLGSTSLKVTTRAVCPVVAWRSIAAPTDAAVLVGVDGTEASTAALATAFTFADSFGVPVRAVHCWSRTMGVDSTTLPYLVDWAAAETAENALLDEALKPWIQRFPNVKVECLVDTGKPSDALLKQLEDVQLVIVGTHRNSALSAAILGSTSLNLLHHSTVPVVVCHAATT